MTRSNRALVLAACLLIAGPASLAEESLVLDAQPEEEFQELETMPNVERKFEVKNLQERLDAGWIAAAQAALTRNRSTFAVLPMSNVKSSTGYLVKLAELGYTVEDPE